MGRLEAVVYFFPESDIHSSFGFSIMLIIIMRHVLSVLCSHSFFIGTVLLHARHIYRKDRLVAERQSWRCRVRGCPGRVLTDLAQPPRVVEERAMHYHMPDDELFCSRRMKGSLCQLAEDHPLESLSRVSRMYIFRDHRAPRGLGLDESEFTKSVPFFIFYFIRPYNLRE